MRENLPSMGPVADDNRPRLRVEGVEQFNNSSTKDGAPNGRVEVSATFFHTERHSRGSDHAAKEPPAPPVADGNVRPESDAPPRPNWPTPAHSPADVLLKAYAPRRETEVPAQQMGGTAARGDAPRTRRPRVLDVHKMGQICGLLAAGMSRRRAASFVGCDPKTITNEVRRNEKFDEDVNRAEAHAELAPLKCLYNAATKHWRAAAWLLEKLERKNQVKKKKREMTPEELMLEDQKLLRALGP